MSRRSDYKNDEDDLHMEELDEPTTAPKPSPKPKETEPGTSAKAKTGVKFRISKDDLNRRTTIAAGARRTIFEYIKIIVLFIIWCISAFFLMTTAMNVKIPRLFAISSNQIKEVEIPVMKISSRLGLSILGPFVVEDDIPHSHLESSKSNIMEVQVMRQHFDAADPTKLETFNASISWKLRMVPIAELSTTDNRRKNYVFDLTETQSQYEKNKLMLRVSANIAKDITVKVWYDPFPINKSKGVICGTLVLIFLYVLIIWEIINRTFASIIASTLAIGVMAAFDARPSMSTVMSWIDVETLLLLFGMMVLVAILTDSGVFDYLAVFAYDLTKGKVWPLINTLCAFVGVLSAFLDNVTMMLLVAPVTIRLCEVLAMNPVPILMCMVLFSNIGAALTPVGDPPNIIICSNSFIAHSNVHFGNFVVHMLPGVLLAAVLVYACLRWKYRNIAKLKYEQSQEVEDMKHEIHAWQRAAEGISAYSKDETAIREALLKKVERLKDKLAVALENQKPPPEAKFEETLKNLQAEYPIRDKILLIKATFAFSFVIVLFCLHSIPHFHYLTMGWTALLGALLLLILADVEDMEAILVRVEWSTLLFFATLFILMEALAELGVIDVIGNMVIYLVLSVRPDLRLTLALCVTLWVSALTSAFINNVPVTTMMVKIIITLSESKDLQLPLHPLVWALAFGACFGGNGTIIGASANVVSAGIIEQRGYKMSFIQFFIIGFPVMIGSIIIVTLYLLLAHVVFTWH